MLSFNHIFAAVSKYNARYAETFVVYPGHTQHWWRQVPFDYDNRMKYQETDIPCTDHSLKVVLPFEYPTITRGIHFLVP